MYLKFMRSSVLACCTLATLSGWAKDAVPAVGQGLTKPICFIENKGQVQDNNKASRTDISYKLSSQGMNLYLGKAQLYYQFRQIQSNEPGNLKDRLYNTRVTLQGANPNAKIEAMEQQEYVENYYIASAPDGATAHAYNKVVYKEVYPGIDWVLYIKDGKVEYDFVVRPGADASQIKMVYEGADLSIDKDGSLVTETPLGKTRQQAPYSYVQENRKKVASSFRLNGNVVSFNTAAHNGTLVIDPSVLWSTYYGGANEDVVTGIKIATNSMTLAGGRTFSAGLGFGTGFDVSYNGGADAFVARYTVTGTLSWATYVGGAGNDYGTCIAIDASNNPVLGGYTSSSGLGFNAGMPNPAPWHMTYGGGVDGFVMKLAFGAGTRTWCTYFGGAGDDYVYGVACDGAGNVVATGSTSTTTATQIRSSAGVHQPNISGVTDAFLVKLGSAGGNNIFSTYYGGPNDETGYGIACDAFNNIIFTGQTNSGSAISTTGAYQPALTGITDAFIAKFTSGGIRSWGTYFGGSGDETGKGVVCHPSTGAIAVVGNTTSAASVSTTLNTQQPVFGGLQDGFLAWFYGDGKRKWASYYGGSDVDFAEGVCMDRENNILMAGATFSTNNIASTLGYQTTNGGDYDAYIARFDTLGRRMSGTYFGNVFYEYAHSVASDGSNGQFAIGGYTSSLTGITTTGVQQTAYGGGLYDGFVTKFNAETTVVVNQPYNDTLLCLNGSFNLPYTVNLNFTGANVFTAQLSDMSGSFASPVNIGSVGSTTTGTIPVTIPSTVTPGYGYRIRIVSSAPAFISPDSYRDIRILAALPAGTVTATSPVCVGSPINFTDIATYPVSGYSWVGPVGSGFASPLQNPTIPSATLANDGVYTVSTSHTGCPARVDMVTVVVNSVIPTAPVLSSNSPVCNLDSLFLTATPTATGVMGYSWTGPGGFTSTLQNPSRAGLTPATAGVYSLVNTVDACAAVTTTINVVVTPNTPNSLLISASPNDTVCVGDTVTFTAVTVNSGSSPQFQWYRNGAAVVGATTNPWTTPTLINNDAIWCTMISSEPCPFPKMATSNIINMAVINNSPLAFIAVSPGSSVAPGTTVTFTSSVSNAGTAPLYQWKKNGIAIPGATNATYIETVTSTTNETITLFFTNGMNCAIPSSVTSNAIKLHSNVGVPELSSSLGDINLFPNPNKGIFTVHGDITSTSGNAVSVKVVNPLGQVVYQTATDVPAGYMNKELDLGSIANGVYMLNVSVDGQSKVIRFTVNR